MMLLHVMSFLVGGCVDMKPAEIGGSVIKLSEYVTGFAKSGLIHTSDFTTLIGHNYVCDKAIAFKYSSTLHIRLIIGTSSYKISKL